MLYEVPQHIDVKSKIMKSEEMLSSQMLSGIPEVNLGIEAKMRNIEATEEARQKVQQEMSQKRSEPTVMVPTNMATNFLLHNRCKFLNPFATSSCTHPASLMPCHTALVWECLHHFQPSLDIMLSLHQN